MKTSPSVAWTLADLARLEHLRLQDRAQDTETLTQRDRLFYQQQSQPNWTRSDAMAAWVQWRQAQSLDNVDAGFWLQRALTGLSVLLVLSGLLSGVGITAAALYYDGSVPINVSWYLGIIVVPQVFLLILMVLLGLLAMIAPGTLGRAYQWPARLLQQGLSWFGQRRGGAAQQQAQQLAMTIEQLGERYRQVLSLRLLRILQWSGVSFNLAVLITTAALLAVTDRAFGWQSALFTDPEQVHSWLVALAAPWQWLGLPGWSLPSLNTVIESRIVLRDMEAAQTVALGAWWPFLMLCVLCYGLLPRLTVGLILVWRERRALDHIQWNTPDLHALWMRMRSVALSTEGKPSAARSEYAASDRLPEITPASSWPAQTWVLEESVQRYPVPVLKQLLAPETTAITPVARFSPKPGARAEVSELALLLEGWQAPIQEQLSDIQHLAAEVAELHIVLLGKPTATGVQPLRPERAQVWRQKLALLALSNLFIHTLATEDSA